MSCLPQLVLRGFHIFFGFVHRDTAIFAARFQKSSAFKKDYTATDYRLPAPAAGAGEYAPALAARSVCPAFGLYGGR